VKSIGFSGSVNFRGLRTPPRHCKVRSVVVVVVPPKIQLPVLIGLGEEYSKFDFGTHTVHGRWLQPIRRRPHSPRGSGLGDELCDFCPAQLGDLLEAALNQAQYRRALLIVPCGTKTRSTKHKTNAICVLEPISSLALTNQRIPSVLTSQLRTR
jgi:hypothetical protein